MCSYLVYQTLHILFSVVTNELVEFETQLIEVQDFRRIIHCFRGIYLDLIKEILEDRNI